LLFTHLLPNRYSRPLIIASAIAVAIFVACGGGDVDPTSVADVVIPESTHDVSCVLSGPSSEFEVRAVPGVGVGVLPTELDDVNTAVCIFPEKIVEVKVTLLHVAGPLAGLEAIFDSIAIEASSVIGFPIAARADRVEVSSLLPLGRYVRKMKTVTEAGGLIEIQTALNEIATEVFLVNAPNATIMLRTGMWRSRDERWLGQNG
jgi:hypothetical protein